MLEAATFPRAETEYWSCCVPKEPAPSACNSLLTPPLWGPISRAAELG